MPTTASPSTTGTALIRRSIRSAAISGTDASGVTVTTGVVITSRAFIRSPRWRSAFLSPPARPTLRAL
jgi:hypothetical protein